MSRAYYAVFAALADRLVASKVTFPDDREAPPHGDRLYAMIQSNLSGLSAHRRRDVKRLTTVLYGARLSAGYSRRSRIGLSEARECILQAQTVFKHWGVTI